MKKIAIFAVAILLLLGSTLMAQDIRWYRVTAVNGTGGAVDDFHATFIGTGGSVSNLKIITDPGTGATATITSGADVDITWDAGSVAADATLVFSFSAEYSGITGDAEWTVGGEGAGAVVLTIEELPYSPAPSLTQYGLIGLAVLIVISGVWIYRRRRVGAAA